MPLLQTTSSAGNALSAFTESRVPDHNKSDSSLLSAEANALNASSEAVNGQAINSESVSPCGAFQAINSGCSSRSDAGRPTSASRESTPLIPAKAGAASISPQNWLVPVKRSQVPNGSGISSTATASGEMAFHGSAAGAELACQLHSHQAITATMATRSRTVKERRMAKPQRWTQHARVRSPVRVPFAHSAVDAFGDELRLRGQ